MSVEKVLQIQTNNHSFTIISLDDIYSLSLAPSLPTLPFEVFRQLLDSSPLTTDDGMLLRRMVIEVGAMHLVLNCLSIFTHHSPVYPLGNPQTEVFIICHFPVCLYNLHIYRFRPQVVAVLKHRLMLWKILR